LGRTMIERSIKKLLLESLQETGDDPEDVSCVYSFYNGESTASDTVLCLATKLPETELAFLFCNSRTYNYELVRKGKGPQIETSVREGWQNARD